MCISKTESFALVEEIGQKNSSKIRAQKVEDQQYCRTPLSPLDKFLDISTKLTYLEITGYQVKHSTAF
jgi:hypothetical protein